MIDRDGPSRLRQALPRRRHAVPVVLVALVGTALAGAFAAAVPPGQPYDEPAHWANVLFYLDHGSMPVLGQPGVQYEAQMGPVYYAVSAAVLALADAGHGEATFHLVRAGWLILIPLLAALTYRLALLVGVQRTSAALATALVVLNPLVLAMSASIQNDVLCIVLGAAGSLLALQAMRTPGGPLRPHAMAGAVLGLAVLTKVFALGLVVGLLVAYAVDWRLTPWHRLRRGLAALAAMAAVSGWWFVRNVILYGDLTGQAGVAATGYRFPALRFSGAGSLLAWGRSLVSYAYAPTEYFRNAVNAPTWLEAAAVASTGGIVLALLLRWRRSRAGHVQRRPQTRLEPSGYPSAVVFALAATVVVFAGYAVLAWTSQGIAPRLTFVAAPLAAALLARAAESPAGRAALGAALVVFVVSGGWLARSVAGLPPMPYWIFGASNG